MLAPSYTKFNQNELRHLYERVDILKAHCVHPDSRVKLRDLELLVENFIAVYDLWLHDQPPSVGRIGVMAVTMDNTLAYPCVEWAITKLSISVMVEPLSLNWSIVCTSDDNHIKLNDIIEFQTASNEEAVKFIMDFVKKVYSQPSSTP